MSHEIFQNLGESKCEEMAKKSLSLWHLNEVCEGRRSAQVGGAIREAIARDFIREFLPPGFGLKGGQVLDNKAKRMSPQIDGIIYKGVPLLQFTDAAIVEKQQVKAIFEIKSYIDQSDIFGSKTQSDRNPNSGLYSCYMSRKPFLGDGGKYILFAFELYSSVLDNEVSNRLNGICDEYAVVIRRESTAEVKAGKEKRCTNFNNSVGKLIEWMRNLE